MSPSAVSQTTRRTGRRTRLRRRRSRLRSPAHLPASHPSPSKSSNRASPVVGQYERVHAHSRRDRRVACGPANAVAAIFEREPWRHCGKSGRSTERPMSTPRHAKVPRESPAAQGRIKARKVRRSVGEEIPANSNDAPNIARYPAQLAVLTNAVPWQSFRHPAAIKMTATNFRVDPGCSFRHWRGCSRAQQAMIAWRQRAGSPAAGQGHKPAEPVARSASLDGLMPGRPTSPQVVTARTEPTGPSARESTSAGARSFDV